MMLNIILQIAQPLFKRKRKTGGRSRSGSATGSAYFLLEAEAPEEEALRVEAEAEAEALEILALPHHWSVCLFLCLFPLCCRVIVRAEKNII
jgi:hypothetical protein